MINISLYNRNPIELTFEHPAGQPLPQEPALTILDQQEIACSHIEADRFVFVELDGVESGPPPATTVVIRSSSHRVHVWEQTAAGYSSWPRDSGGGCHRTYAAPTDTTVCVQMLAPGEQPAAGPPAAGSGSTTLLKVKVRKKGELPI